MPRATTAMTTTALERRALLRLLAWLSPAYPVGAFSYSHGLEQAVEAGLVRDRPGLVDWTGAVLRHGGGRSDAVLLAHAHRGAADPAALGEVLELARAFLPTAELALESLAQGEAFLRTTRAVWPEPALPLAGEAPYPVAVGVAAAVHRLPLAPLLTAWLHAFAANLVSAGVRLIPLGQTDGQRALAALEPTIEAAAARAETVALDELGTATFMVDWCSMRHETQYTRLFRS
jgi:urease accessory protein